MNQSSVIFACFTVSETFADKLKSVTANLQINDLAVFTTDSSGWYVSSELWCTFAAVSKRQSREVVRWHLYRSNDGTYYLAVLGQVDALMFGPNAPWATVVIKHTFGLVDDMPKRTDQFSTPAVIFHDIAWRSNQKNPTHVAEEFDFRPEKAAMVKDTIVSKAANDVLMGVTRRVSPAAAKIRASLAEHALYWWFDMDSSTHYGIINMLKAVADTGAPIGHSPALCVVMKELVDSGEDIEELLDPVSRLLTLDDDDFLLFVEGNKRMSEFMAEATRDDDELYGCDD